MKVSELEANRLASQIVTLAEGEAFFYEYDGDYNTGEYYQMEYDTYIKTLTRKVSLAIQEHGMDARAIYEETKWDWAAETDDLPDFEDEVMEYIEEGLKA